jgi:hypothetical protein
MDNPTAPGANLLPGWLVSSFSTGVAPDATTADDRAQTHVQTTASMTTETIRTRQCRRSFNPRGNLASAERVRDRWVGDGRETFRCAALAGTTPRPAFAGGNA